MSSTGTRKERNIQARVSDALTENDRIFIENLKLFSADSGTISGLAGGTISNSPKTAAGNFLSRNGDSMIGPIALGPPVDFTIEINANNTIDISSLNENAQFSSNLQFENIQPNSFILDIVAGAAFDGQILILRTVAPSEAITIRQGTLENGGNIQVPDNEDFQMRDLEMIFLVFDEALRIESNTGGSWRVLSGSGATGGSPTVLNNLNEFNHGELGLFTLNLDWQVANFQRIVVTGELEIGFANLPAPGKWQSIIIEITQDNIGGHGVEFLDAPFLNGTPVVGTNPNETTSIQFYSYNTGTANVIVWAFWSGSQTPWLQNVDANKFILFDLNDVLFTNTVLNAPSATTSSIFWSNATSDFVFQIQEGDDFKIIQGITETVGNTVATFNKSTIDFGIQTLPFTVLETGDLLNQGIAQFNKTVTLKTNNVTFPQPSIRPSTDVPDPFEGGDLGTSSVSWNNLFVKQIRLQDGFVISNRSQISQDDDFNGMVLNVPAGNQINFFEDGDAQFIVGGGFIEVFADMDFNNVSTIGNVVRVTFSESFGAGTPDNNTIYTQPLNNFFVFQARDNDQIRFLQGDDFVNDVFATFTKDLIDFTHETLPFTQFFAGDTIIKGISNFRKTMVLVTIANPPVGFPNPTFRISEDVSDPFEGGDLGITTVPWNNLFVKHLRLRDGFTIVNDNSIAFDSDFDAIIYNVGTVGFKHIFSVSDGATSKNDILEIELSQSTFFSSLDMTNKRISTVADPIDQQDAVNLRFVQQNFAISADSGLFAQKVKQNDDTVTNTTVFVEDGELQFNALKDTIYYIEVNGIVQTGATSVKFALSMPSGSSYRIATGFAPGQWSPSTTANGGEKVVFSQSVSEPINVNFFIILQVGSTEGGVKILFGQEFASVSDTVLEKGSLMRVYADTQQIPNFILQVNGTKNFTVDDEHVDDTGDRFFGEAFGVEGLTTVLPIVKPGAGVFTFEHEITTSMLPNGINNFNEFLFQIYTEFQFKSNDTVTRTLNVEMLINNVVSQFRSINVAAGRFVVYRAEGLPYVVVGDKVQLKAWVSGGTDFQLQTVVMWMHIAGMKFKGQSLSILFSKFTNLFALFPSTITTPPVSFEDSIGVFEFNSVIDNFAGPTIGENAPITLFNDDWLGAFGENNLSTNTQLTLFHPAINFMGEWNVRT